jgi:peptide/nickel transport system permease protein
MIPTVVLVGVFAFLLIHMVPGDPAMVMLGSDATPQQLEMMRKEMGLDQPLITQFMLWAGKAVRGDLGRSYFLNMSVTQAILQRFPATLELSVLALVLAVLIGVPLGIAAAVRQNTVYDQILMSVSLVGVSFPSFWIGLLLMLVFSVQFGIFPTGGYVALNEGFWPWLHRLILPALALGFQQSALIARMTRSSMLEVLRQDYVRTAKAKGMKSRTVIMKHALRNCLTTVVTVIGTSFSTLMGGAMVVETVFTYPGVGRLVVMAVQRRDYPLVQGTLMFIALVCVLVNLLVDISYSAIDPRIRYD